MVAGIISCRSSHPIRRRPTHATATDHAPPRGQIDPDTTLGWLRRFLPLVRAHQALFVVTLTLGLASTIAMMTSPVYLQQAIDDGLINRSAPLSKFVWILSGLVTFSGITGVLNRRLMTRVSARIEYDLRAIVQQKLARQSFAFHDQTETGQLISRANSDLRVIQMFLVFGPSLATLYVGFFYALVLMLRAHVGLTLVTLSVMPAVIFVGIRMRQITFPLSHLVQARTADVTSIVEENLAGAHVVRAMSAEVDQIKRLDIASDGLRWAAEQEVIVRARYQPLMSLIPQAGTALFLLVAGWLTIADRVTVGAIVLFTAYVGILHFPFRALGYFVMMGQRARAASGRIFEMIDREPTVLDRPGARVLDEVRGELRLENVHFTFDGSTPVLRGLDLHVRQAETLAIVGRTASGKSALLNLIPRFYDVTSGRILVDGHDVRDLTQTSLRSNVGVVMDEAFLFTATIRENIAYARPDAPQEVLTAAAEAAGAIDFISQLPQGWDTVVGERGYTLSGGQRQRIAIARVLVQNPAILLLDDATSAVDVEVEHRIHQALGASLAGRTTILVAHRPATIALADRVAVMDQGQIIATGTHDWLLANESRYRQILAQQAGAT